MNDDLERRLRQVGTTPVDPLSARSVQSIEDRLFAAGQPVSRAHWLAAAAAVLVLAVAAAAFGLQRDRSDTLQPVSPPTEPAPVVSTTSSTVALGPTTTASPTTTAPSTTLVNGGELPPSIPAPVTTVAGGNGTTPPSPTVGPTSPTTTPPTTTPPAPTSTLPAPQPVPASSFTLTVQRVGDKLVFSWPAYTGTDGRRYVLVRTTPAGLNNWPVAPSRVARTIADMGATRTVLDMPTTDQKAWVLVVLGENRELLAVSTVAISN